MRSSFLPRSMEFRGSGFVGLGTRNRRIDEGYTWVPEKRVSSKIQERRFWKIKVFGSTRLPTLVSHA